MRISRLLVITVASLGLLTLPATPYASAADFTVVVQDLGQLPTDGSYGLSDQSCVTPGPIVAKVPLPDIRKGPAPVPLGLRTWGFQPAQGSAVGPYRAIDSMGTVMADQVSAYADHHSTGVAIAEVLVDGGQQAWYGVSQTPFAVPAGAWTTVSGLGATYNWIEVNIGSTEPLDTFTGDVTAMLAHNGQNDQSGYLGLLFGCNGKGPVHLDDAQFGGPSDVATYDFEGPTTRTTVHASPRLVVAGRPVTITGVTQARDGSPLLRARLILQGRAFGSSRWKKVGTATETFSGRQRPAKLRVRPLLKTTYRWVYQTSQAASGSTSGGAAVQVRTAVTAHVAATSVRRGGTIVVTGKVTPHRAGHVVDVFRGSHKIGHTTIGRHGTYRFTTKATSAGVWTLHVTISAGAGDRAGASRPVKVRVH